MNDLVLEMLLINGQIYAEYLTNCLVNLSAGFENIFTCGIHTRMEYENLPKSVRHLELLSHATIYVMLVGKHKKCG